ncbi:actin-related protein 10 [Teleopsis dalmanni]|uniref:actin-related protein 10 n=1 Tax=Teleopsis dalmanni TaxID=139649 RepID=UPI000D32980B|nr:actin-related protein 10 [Teleopsis dalmanni]
MPLYETVMQEKPPIVFDVGTAYTKFGFAGETCPRKIVRSEVICLASKVTKPLFQYEDSLEFYDQIVDFLQMIFFKYLLVSPKDRKFVIVENVFDQTEVRDALVRILFRHFEVSSVLFVPTHIMAISTLAISSGIVIDIGYSETNVMPIYSGVQILKAFQDQRYGGQLIHKEIKRQLISIGVKENLLSEKVLEDIKIRTCFVTNFARAQCYRSNQKLEVPPNIEYSINGTQIITIPGSLRETAFEILFETSNERDNLPHLILQSILKCPLDVRRELTENIYVIGGSSIIMGLLPRLKDELNFLIETDYLYTDKLYGKIQFKFHKTIGCQNFCAWLGGSLCGATDLIQTRSLTKEAFFKTNRVPDWICLADNRLTGT